MRRSRTRKRSKRKFGAGHKPGSVPSRRIQCDRTAMIIPLGPLLPGGSSNLPESLDGPPSNALLFGLAPGGVCLASDVATGTGELLPHRFTLTPSVRGGLLSVALSCSSPRLGVTQHPALRSPDFPPIPHARTGDHLPCSKSFTEDPFIAAGYMTHPERIRGFFLQYSVNGAHNKAEVTLQGLIGFVGRAEVLLDRIPGFQ